MWKHQMLFLELEQQVEMDASINSESAKLSDFTKTGILKI